MSRGPHDPSFIADPDAFGTLPAPPEGAFRALIKRLRQVLVSVAGAAVCEMLLRFGRQADADLLSIGRRALLLYLVTSAGCGITMEQSEKRSFAE